jgi:hypothetical protein
VILSVYDGATFLDNVNPGWYREIDTGNMDVSDEGGDCPLRQLYGSYTKGVDTLGITSERAVELGFNVVASPVAEFTYEQFSRRTEEWVKAVEERLMWDSELAELDIAVTV